MKLTIHREPPVVYEHPREDSHEFFEVLLLESGSGVIEVDGDNVVLQAGDVICIPPHTLHRDRSTSPRANSIVTFPSTAYPSFEGYRHFHDTNNAFLNLFTLAYETQMSQSPNADALVSALGEAMLQLLRYWGYGDGQSTGVVAQVQRSILANFADPAFNLADEIRATGYNTNYFRRLFKSAYGLPPLEYLSRVRIESAKNQMQLYGSAMPIQSYARSAGIPDPAYFSRLFRQSEGCSPSQYLENL